MQCVYAFTTSKRATCSDRVHSTLHSFVLFACTRHKLAVYVCLLHLARDETSPRSRSPSLARPPLRFADAPGFVRALAEIATSRDVTPAPRLLGMLLLKSLVERHWRAGAPTDTLPAADRAAIQERLLTAPHEPDDAVATQEALVVGKIARVELPQGWPALMPCVLESIRGAQVRACVRACMWIATQAQLIPTHHPTLLSSVPPQIAFIHSHSHSNCNALVSLRVWGMGTQRCIRFSVLSSIQPPKHARCKAPVLSVGSL
jgi:hypothetical protein